MPTVDFYSKGQTDSLLSAKANATDLPSSAQLVPSTSGASSGDVLTFDGSNIGWAAGGSGGSGITAHTYASFNALLNDFVQNKYNEHTFGSNKSYDVSGFIISKNTILGIARSIDLTYKPSTQVYTGGISFERLYAGGTGSDLQGYNAKLTFYTDTTTPVNVTQNYVKIYDASDIQKGSSTVSLSISELIYYY